MDKEDALKHAIEVAKEAARGGHTTPSYVLELTFRKIVELMPDATRGH